jgi:hypothetical protein
MSNTAASLGGICDVVRNGRAVPPALFRTVLVVLTGAALPLAYELSSCYYVVNVHKTPVMTYVTQGRHGLVL